MLRLLNRFPATILFIIINTIVFAWCWYSIGTFQEPEWTQGLLFRGAEFAPLTLSDEWYRIITHMFMHGGIAHLLFNMYALFVVGSEVEQITGTRKYLLLYFISGFAAALASLYFNLFSIGVGASGAIFGLFGFSLLFQLIERRNQSQSVIPVLLNFLLFFGINLIYSEVMNADIAAHIGGLLGGLVVGMISVFSKSNRSIRLELVLLPVLGLLFVALPRYPVTYFDFYQKVLSIEDSTQALFNRADLSDEQFLAEYKKINPQWDTAFSMLEGHAFLPKELHNDTVRLNGYMRMRKQEGAYRELLIEKQIYRYLDSIDLTVAKMNSFFPLDYPLSMMRPIQKKSNDKEAPHMEVEHVWFDKDWNELAFPPGEYYRIGSRDSLKRWQGPVLDYYKNGKIQMKGTYLDNEQNGIFLYYSDHDTYSSAGRYAKGEPVGKWESFHSNGQLEKEEFFNGSYFLGNMWDSLGNQIVRDGEGVYLKRYENGEIEIQGSYHDGRRDGNWFGNHKNGKRYFEEFYRNGYLETGRARTEDGMTYLYDQSSLFPMPEGGNEALLNYLEEAIKKSKVEKSGAVVLSFRVSTEGVLTEFKVEESLAGKSDSLAIELIRKGPRWIPARLHGHQFQNGYGHVTIEF